jgi:hypothetical protein
MYSRVCAHEQQQMGWAGREQEKLSLTTKNKDGWEQQHEKHPGLDICCALDKQHRIIRKKKYLLLARDVRPKGFSDYAAPVWRVSLIHCFLHLDGTHHAQ